MGHTKSNTIQDVYDLVRLQSQDNLYMATVLMPTWIEAVVSK